MNPNQIFGMGNNGLPMQNFGQQLPQQQQQQPPQQSYGQANGGLSLNPTQIAQLTDFHRQQQMQQSPMQRQGSGNISLQQNARPGMPQGLGNPALVQQVLAAQQRQQNPGLAAAALANIQNGRMTPQEQTSLLQRWAQQNQGGQAMNGIYPAQLAQVVGQLSQQRNQQFQPAAQVQRSVSPALLQQSLPQLPMQSQPQMQQPSQPQQQLQTMAPSFMTTPPIPSGMPRLPSPPHPAESRRPSLPTQQSFQQSSASTPEPAPPTFGLPPPASFKLDDSKLKHAKVVPPPPAAATSDTSSIAGPPAAPTPPATGTSTPEKAKPKKKKKPPATLPPPPANPTFIAAATGQTAQAPKAGDIQPRLPEHRPATPTNAATHHEAAETRRRHAEGMRGSMRNEISRLMYASGDTYQSDGDAVDFMEDMLVDFIGDLCRPVAPMRSSKAIGHQAVPLTVGVLRHRLAHKPALRKYLDRFDLMCHLTIEIQAARRAAKSTETPQDLIEAIGKDYLGVEEEQQQQQTSKKRGRPRGEVRKQAMLAAASEKGEEGKEKRKPGPKKGWKAARIAAGDYAEPKFDADGKKIKRPYKRRKLGEGPPAASSPA